LFISFISPSTNFFLFWLVYQTGPGCRVTTAVAFGVDFEFCFGVSAACARLTCGTGILRKLESSVSAAAPRAVPKVTIAVRRVMGCWKRSKNGSFSTFCVILIYLLYLV
jgi:hypothetical protein